MWNNWVIIFICSSLTLVELKLLEMSTRNVAVVVGQPCIIICQFTSTDNISSLHFTPLSSSKEVLIWSAAIGKDSKKFVDPFTVFKDHLNVTLYLNSTSLNSAGTFTWRGTNPIGEAYSAIKSSGQLIVLDGNLRCNSTVRGSTLNEYESVEMKCDIGYRGNWAPAMEWRFSGNDIHVHRQIVREGVRTIYVSNSLVVSVFNFTVYHTMNNRNVNCKTYFSRYTGNVTATATNPPDYSYTWISPSLNITYGPRNLAITPVQTSYRLGDKLTCSADANPTPMYEWKDNITAFTTLTKGPHYTIPSFVTPFAVECRASNPIGSDSRSVPINLSSGLEPQAYLLISLGILCFLLLLLIVMISGKQIRGRCAIFCEKRKRQQITQINMETSISEIQYTDVHVAGMTLPGHEIAKPQFPLRGNELNSTLYATVNKKGGNPEKAESGTVTTMNRLQTYVGADGTEYLEMGRFRSDPAVFTRQEKHPPPIRPSPYEPVAYASIDHNLSAPPPKMNQYQTHYHKQ